MDSVQYAKKKNLLAILMVWYFAADIEFRYKNMQNLFLIHEHSLILTFYLKFAL